MQQASGSRLQAPGGLKAARPRSESIGSIGGDRRRHNFFSGHHVDVWLVRYMEERVEGFSLDAPGRGCECDYERIMK